MKAINALSVQEILQGLETNELNCVSIIEETLNNIQKYDTHIGSFISVFNREDLLAQATASDQRRAEGKQLSQLDGVPIAIKDDIVTKDTLTTAGSQMLATYKPPYDATVVTKLQEAGLIIIGKTNMDEFNAGTTTESSIFQLTVNPHDGHKIAGGSSGGAAAAVSAGFVPFAIGSDADGGVCQPASYCGVVGLKPTYGTISRFGLISSASSFEQIGVIARKVEDAAMLLDLLIGEDKKDATTRSNIQETFNESLAAHLTKPIKALRLCYAKEAVAELDETANKHFMETLEHIKELGITITEVSIPSWEHIIPTHCFISAAEIASNMSRFDGVKFGYRSDKQEDYEIMLHSSRTEALGFNIKKKITFGNLALSSEHYQKYYKQAQRIRTIIIKELHEILSTYDGIISATTNSVAYDLGSTQAETQLHNQTNLLLANMAGLPAGSVPVIMENNLPLGLHCVMGEMKDALLLQFMSALETKVAFKEKANISKIDTTFIAKHAHIKEKTTTTRRYSKEDITRIAESYIQRKKNDDPRVLCVELPNNIGKSVEIAGSIYKINNLGGIEFYSLRDRSGLTQLVLEGELAQIELNPLSTVRVVGEVTKEARSPYGEIEIKVKTIEILSEATSDVPFVVSNDLANLNLPTLLDHRAISLRNIEVLNVFKVQAEIASSFAEFLRDNGFTEIKTPKIIANETEGGTNVFEIKYFDRQAFLAQSPQFYKQMMVGSGMERVFEIGPVFRAEKHNTVRHLNEYTSLDFEMGYIKDEQDLIDMQERLLIHILTNIKKKHQDVLDYFKQDIWIPDSIPRIHFVDALEIAESYGARDLDGDISPEGEKMLCKYVEETYKSQFVYVVGYPVKKRPMYTMQDERLPGYTRSFDLLYKGLEITTGGQRIHRYEDLKKNMLAFGLNPAAYKDYLEAFKYGMPPHGGLGMGLERVTMKLLGLENIREATLFPRDIGRLEP